MQSAVAQEEFDTRAFRNALGCFPTGVAIVTAKPSGKPPIGLTISSFASVSLDPPMVLWSLRRDARSKDDILAAGHFIINVLDRRQEELATRFSKPASNRFEDVETTTNSWGAPYIAGSVACFECQLDHCLEGGDHVILLGQVKHFRYSAAPPLVFCNGRFASVGNSSLPLREHTGSS